MIMWHLFEDSVSVVDAAAMDNTSPSGASLFTDVSSSRQLLVTGSYGFQTRQIVADLESKLNLMTALTRHDNITETEPGIPP